MPGADDRTPEERSRFANERQISKSDEAIVEAKKADRGRDPRDRPPGSLVDDDDIRKDVGARPVGDTTAAVPGSGDDETADGLDELEESVRQQAEDRALGDNQGFRR